MRKFNLMLASILLIIIIASVLASCAPQENTNPSPNTSQSTKGTGLTKKNIIGDTVSAEKVNYTVNGTRTSEGNDIFKPKGGNIYYMVDVTAENKSSESKAISSLMMFKLSDNQGYNYNITIGPDTKGQMDGSVDPGKKLRGELAFEIPKTASGLELQIDPSLTGASKINFTLNR